MDAEVLRLALSQRIGCQANSVAVAEGLLAVWLKMALCLEPVLGTGGVDVLFARALTLAKGASPRLAVPGVHGNSASSLACMCEAIAKCDTHTAIQISQQILAKFVELLENLIGARLTASLLRPAWVPDSRT